VPGCEARHYAHGLCRRHAGKAYAYGLTPEQVVALYGSPTCASCGRPWGTTRDTQPVVDHDPPDPRRSASPAGPATSVSVTSVMTPTGSPPPPATSSRPHRRTRRRKNGSPLTAADCRGHRAPSSPGFPKALTRLQNLGRVSVMVPATPWTPATYHLHLPGVCKGVSTRSPAAPRVFRLMLPCTRMSIPSSGPGPRALGRGPGPGSTETFGGPWIDASAPT
jgi:hypothetical protein